MISIRAFLFLATNTAGFGINMEEFLRTEITDHREMCPLITGDHEALLEGWQVKMAWIMGVTWLYGSAYTSKVAPLKRLV